MVNLSIILYYIFFALIFFIKIPNYLLMIVGIGVFISISYYFLKSTNYKYFSISSLLVSALVSAIIILILGSLQTLVIGFDITNNLNHTIFKLYSILCLFVSYTLIAKLKEYNKKKIR